MSQYNFINSDGNRVMYGLDKPTGGYFWQEFDPDEEETIVEKDGLSLTTLVIDLMNMFNFNVSKQMLIEDFTNERYPTILQINVGKMFNKDIASMLEEVEGDVTRHMMILHTHASDTGCCNPDICGSSKEL